MSIKEQNERASAKSLTDYSLERHAPLEGRINDPRVRTVIDFMQTNLDQPIALTDLARIANLSLFRLAHLFKTETALPPAEFLRRLRMEKACHLLETSFLSVKEIMVMSGYGDKNHFTRQFKKSIGVTPSEYRKRPNQNGAARHDDK